MGLSGAYHIKTADSKRNKNDFYPTAPIATYALTQNHDVPSKILEPAAGEGWISYELNKNGIQTLSQDLYQYSNTLVPVDFGIDFMESPKMDVGGMITNPPFRSGMPLKFVEKSLKQYDFTALFCRLTFLETGKRGKFLQEYPMTKMLVLYDRINCDSTYFHDTKRQLGGMIAYAWYIWDNRVSTKNEIAFCSPKDIMPEFIKLRGKNYV